MAEAKTRPTEASVDSFIDAIADERRRAECRTVLQLMRAETGAEPVLWGPSIVGFGKYRYHYESGRQGEWCLTGFSPRSKALTLYIMAGFDRYDDLLSRLGTFTTGKSCLYIKRLSDIDVDVLRELVRASVTHMRATSAS